MNKTKLIQSFKKTIKWTGKVLLILLTIIFTILVIISLYLLIADFFYDGRFDERLF